MARAALAVLYTAIPGASPASVAMVTVTSPSSLTSCPAHCVCSRSCSHKFGTFLAAAQYHIFENRGIICNTADVRSDLTFLPIKTASKAVLSSYRESDRAIGNQIRDRIAYILLYCDPASSQICYFYQSKLPQKAVLSSYRESDRATGNPIIIGLRTLYCTSAGSEVGSE
jgi:hypothetical protein